MKLLFIALGVLVLSACTGRIETVKSPVFKEVDGEQVIDGVLFYGYTTRKVPVEMDRIRNKVTGEITHSNYERKDSGKYCARRTIYKTVIVPNHDAKYAIRYKPMPFETIKFNVELENGMLKSVNSESTPGAQTAVDTVKGVLSLGDPPEEGVSRAAGNYIECSTNE